MHQTIRRLSCQFSKRHRVCPVNSANDTAVVLSIQQTTQRLSCQFSKRPSGCPVNSANDTAVILSIQQMTQRSSCQFSKRHSGCPVNSTNARTSLCPVIASNMLRSGTPQCCPGCTISGRDCRSRLASNRVSIL